jgi:hypothetical protein
MNTPTLDFDIVIISENENSKTYERISTGERWVVSGICNQCGLCVVGAVGDWYIWDGPPGTPGANRDTRAPNRLDDPIVPGFIEDMILMAAETPTATVTGCSLSIEVM